MSLIVNDDKTFSVFEDAGNTLFSRIPKCETLLHSRQCQLKQNEMRMKNNSGHHFNDNIQGRFLMF